MHKIYKYSLIIVAGAALTLQGCGKEYFDELSTNPNQVTVATLPALLATSTVKRWPWIVSTVCGCVNHHTKPAASNRPAPATTHQKRFTKHPRGLFCCGG